jgi:hypothetical protein
MKLAASSLLTVMLMRLTVMPLSAGDKPKDTSQAESQVRDALAQLDSADQGWKGRFQALVGLAKAGPAVVPVLEARLTNGSGAARNFAGYALRILRGPAGVTRTLAAFDPRRIDTAHLGQLAPDFTLCDPTGKAYRLSQYRGTKIVVLIFLITED